MKWLHKKKEFYVSGRILKNWPASNRAWESSNHCTVDYFASLLGMNIEHFWCSFLSMEIIWPFFWHERNEQVVLKMTYRWVRKNIELITILKCTLTYFSMCRKVAKQCAESTEVKTSIKIECSRFHFLQKRSAKSNWAELELRRERESISHHRSWFWKAHRAWT